MSTNINLKILRIQPKLEELYQNKIDLSDLPPTHTNLPNEFYTRALAAFAINMKCGVDESIASQSITDGYNDIGIDAIFNDTTQKKLILIQSKWRKNGMGGISQEEIAAFLEGVKRIISLDFEGFNIKIRSREQEITDAIRDMEYQIDMIFCHTGNESISDFVLHPVQDLLHSVNDDDDLLSFQEIKLQDIYEYLANGQNNDSIILNDVLINDWGTVSTPYKAYYGTVSASAVGEWFNEYGNRLFAKNIRYYKGSTEVNQGIKTVLTETPDKFFYYNNGIKILCKKVTRKIESSTTRETGLFALEGVSLVNGAQTTGAIGAVFAERPEVLSNAKVSVQIIDMTNVDEKQATLITKLSNTQNRIESKDFASLDSQQDRLRMELSLGGIQYLYKTGAKIEDPDHQISLDEAIVSQACILDDLSITALAKRNIGALTEDITKTPYILLFNGSTNSFALFNGVLILRIVEQQLKQCEANLSGRERLVLVHGNRFILHWVLKEVANKTSFTTQYLDKTEIETSVKDMCTHYWKLIYEKMEELYPEAYPAHIFKNAGRLKELTKIMFSDTDSVQ